MDHRKKLYAWRKIMRRQYRTKISGVMYRIVFLNNYYNPLYTYKRNNMAYNCQKKWK